MLSLNNFLTWLERRYLDKISTTHQDIYQALLAMDEMGLKKLYNHCLDKIFQAIPGLNDWCMQIIPDLVAHKFDERMAKAKRPNMVISWGARTAFASRFVTDKELNTAMDTTGQSAVIPFFIYLQEKLETPDPLFGYVSVKEEHNDRE